MNALPTNRAAWAEAVAPFLAAAEFRLVRHASPTEDRISPNARARNGYARGERVTWTLHLFVGDRDLTAEFGDARGDLYLPGVLLAGDRYDRKADAEAATVTELARLRVELASVGALIEATDLPGPTLPLVLGVAA